MSTNFVLGVEINGSWTSALLAEEAISGKVVRQRWKTDSRVPGITLGWLNLWVGKELDSRDGELVGVGVGVAAPSENGVLAGTTNLSGWEGLNLRQEFRMFRLPSVNCVVVDNDIVMSALGQYARCPQSLGFLGWSAGVGWERLRKPKGLGRVLPEREALEGGHIIIDVRSRVQCGYGAFGCLERMWEELTWSNALAARPVGLEMSSGFQCSKISRPAFVVLLPQARADFPYTWEAA